MTYQIVEQSGYEDERVVAECPTLPMAQQTLRELYTPDEEDELHVQILKNGTTKY